MKKENLKKILSILPHRPGVYIFKDRRAKVIYIGKAKDLRKRVGSYFGERKDLGPAGHRINLFFGQVSSIDYIVTDSDAEALVLESSLIKKNRPRYNVDLKDDKSYPFIVITHKEKFPRVFLTRNRNIGGGRYFGPYTNVRSARNVLDVLRKTFGIRDCRKPVPGKKGRIPCLNYHINLCLAPCIGNIGEEQYRANIEYIDMFLKGKSRSVEDTIMDKIKKYSSNQEFEKAAELSEVLESIKSLYQKQKIVVGGESRWDVVGVYKQDGKAAVSYFSYRDGELAVVNNFLIENTDYMQQGDVISGFISRYYSGINNMPSAIYIPCPIEEQEGLQEWLKKVKGKKIEIRVPRRGDKKKVMDMAVKNARLYLEKKVFEKDSGHSRAYNELIKLRDELKLKNIPRRMECYDISNLKETFAVGSMAVFADGMPDKDSYRHFKIKNVSAQDDCAMLGEVLGRRIRYLGKDRFDMENSFFNPPDLIIVDGGKAQYNTASAVLNREGITGIDLISIAKKEEVAFCSGYPRGIKLEAGKSYARVLIRIRDEAHRFAVDYHRRLRGKYMTSSFLDQIKGIGEKKKKYITESISSMEELKKSSVQELMNIKGISYKDAINIYNYLHK
ncbi:MAG: excinuclease ABC subunit UvrC [Actinomycetota bacterium]